MSSTRSSAAAVALFVLPKYNIPLTERHVLNQLEMQFDLLERLLQERNYDGAASIYSTLLGHVRESDGLAFTIGFLLIQLIDRLNNENAMKNFFRTVMSHLVPNKTTSMRYNFIILESLMYTLRQGDLVSVTFTLEDQLRADRIAKDHLFQAMRGLISFRKFLSERNHNFSTWLNWKLDDPETPSADHDDPDVKAAIHHMQQALSLQATNSSYLYYLCLFLLQDGDEKQCLDICNFFCTKNPDDALGHLVRAKVLRKLDSDGLASQEIGSWLRYFKIDPASDEAFMALLMHYRQEKIGVSVMLRVLMARMDTVLGFCESLAAWKLFAALLVAREKVLSSRDYSKIGTHEDDRDFLTELYTWKQRYWSLEAWKLQKEEMNTATKITVVLCCILVFGKTNYTLHAIYDLARSSESDLRFHMAPFGAIPALEQHLALVARLRSLHKHPLRRSRAYATHLQAKNAETARRLMNPSEIETLDAIFNPPQPVSTEPSTIPVPPIATENFDTELLVSNSGVETDESSEDLDQPHDNMDDTEGVDLGINDYARRRKRQRELTLDDDDPDSPIKIPKFSDGD